MSKYIATCDFVNSNVGSVKNGDVLPDNAQVRDLCKAGYVREYKTKVVVQKPQKQRRRKSTKKENK